MTQQPPQLLPAVQGLLLSQECALARGAAGQHLSFMAARREEEDRQQLHVAVAFFLQRCTQLLCPARAGCAALLVPDLTCLANPNPTTTSTKHRHPPSTNGKSGALLSASQSVSTYGLTNRLSSSSLVFKSC